MIKKLSVIILCFLLLTGCFDRKELNKIGIVLAVALDKDIAENEIIISCEVLKPYKLGKGGGESGGSGGSSSPIEIVTAKGRTTFDAVRNISKKLDRKSYFSHNKVIIISEKLAAEGVAPVLDVFIRDPEIRPSVWILIAKNTEASEILKVNHGLNQIQALYLNEMIRTRWATSEMQIFSILDFYKKLLKSGSNPTTGAIGIVKENNSPEIALLGTAVFSQDKLIGYLNYKESRGLNWITNEVKSGVINVPGVTKKDEFIAIEIIRTRSKIIPMLMDGKISFIIEVNELANIGEIQDLTDISNLEIISKLESEEKKVIEEEINKVIHKAKYEFKTDILGFGHSLSRYYPKEWNKVENNWNKLFLDIQYEVNINLKLRRSGQIQKPFKPQS